MGADTILKDGWTTTWHLQQHCPINTMGCRAWHARRRYLRRKFYVILLLPNANTSAKGFLLLQLINARWSHVWSDVVAFRLAHQSTGSTFVVLGHMPRIMQRYLQKIMQIHSVPSTGHDSTMRCLVSKQFLKIKWDGNPTFLIFHYMQLWSSTMADVTIWLSGRDSRHSS